MLSKKRLKDKDPEFLQRLLAEAFMNIYVDENKLWNPLEWPTDFNDDPASWITFVMSRPEYFSFICQEIFNIKLLPFQCVIMKELWERKFPMFIMTRGGGKCETKDSIVMSEDRIFRIGEDINELAIEQYRYPCNYKLLGENGYSDVEYKFYNGYTDTLKITTRRGFTKEGTYNHPIRVVNSDNIVWKNLDELSIDNYVIIDRTESWIKNHNNLDINEAYLLGMLVGDGGYTEKEHISFTNQDEELIQAAKIYSKKYLGKSFVRVPSSKYGYRIYSKKIRQSLFSKYGFNSAACGEKDFPSSVLQSSKSACIAFIQGLMDTDGYICKEKGEIGITLKSKKCIETLQFVLTRFGIISKITPKWNKKYKRYYWQCLMSGQDARLFANKIGFRLSYKKEDLSYVNKNTNTNLDILPKELVNNHIKILRDIAYSQINFTRDQKKTLCDSRLDNYNLSYNKFKEILDWFHPIEKCNQHASYIFLENIYSKHYYYDPIVSIEKSKNHTFDFYIPNDHSFISSGFISHNSFSMGVYNLLRMLLLPHRKVLVAGAAFRQSKVVFNYMETVFNNAPLLRDIAKSYNQAHFGPKKETDHWVFYLGTSTTTAVPVGPGGEKIRGQRANDLQVDEFNSLHREIFETVMAGFAAVSSDPINNVEKEAQKLIKKKVEQEWGFEIEKVDPNIMGIDNNYILPNQLLISGTAGYTFQHYYEYWQDWHDIICSKGDTKKLERYLTKKTQESEQTVDDILADLDHKDYGIIRIPYQLMPKGFMDAAQVARAKATMNSGVYANEYGATFSSDSAGFFKSSTIQSCTVHPGKRVISHPGYEDIYFTGTVVGDQSKKYVYGVDPASEEDNFSISIIEMHKNHRRLVYAWTTNKQQQRAEIKAGMTTEEDFFAYCVLKIRDLMQRFPCERIMLDAGGGGIPIREGLMNDRLIKRNEGEQRILEIIEEKEKDTDLMEGLHILQMCQFSNHDWVREANNGLRFDMERKILLFPFFDPLVLSVAEHQIEEFADKTMDSLENCMLEIEDTKEELTTIIITSTNTGRERWDTPEVALPGGKKGRMKKDRYSSLLIANMGARLIQNDMSISFEASIGGAAGRTVAGSGKLYHGNEQYNRAAQEVFDLYG